MISRGEGLAYLYLSDCEKASVEEDQLYVARLESSEIFTLTGAGLLIWDLLHKPCGTDQILEELALIYGVDRDTIAPSVLNFLDSLLEQGLLVEQANL